MKSSIAVVIPCYNHGRFLGGAIESVLGQTLQPSEVVVVDDGSNDNTSEVVAKYGAAVHYVREEENRGLPAARNRGVKETSSEWVAFLDSDDRWMPTKLYKQFEALSHNPDIDVIFTDFWHVAPQGARIDRGSERHRKGLEMVQWDRRTAPEVWVSTNRLIVPLLNGMIACVCTLVMRRSTFQQLGGFNESFRLAEDVDLLLRMACEGFVFGLVPEPLAMIYQHPNSLCRGNWKINEYTLKVLCGIEEKYPLDPNEYETIRLKKADIELSLAWHHFEDGDFRQSRRYAISSVRHGRIWRGLRAWLRACPLVRRL